MVAAPAALRVARPLPTGLVVRPEAPLGVPAAGRPTRVGLRAPPDVGRRTVLRLVVRPLPAVPVPPPTLGSATTRSPAATGRLVALLAHAGQAAHAVRGMAGGRALHARAVSAAVRASAAAQARALASAAVVTSAPRSVVREPRVRAAPAGRWGGARMAHQGAVGRMAAAIGARAAVQPMVVGREQDGRVAQGVPRSPGGPPRAGRVRAALRVVRGRAAGVIRGRAPASTAKAGMIAAAQAVRSVGLGAARLGARVATVAARTVSRRE